MRLLVVALPGSSQWAMAARAREPSPWDKWFATLEHRGEWRRKATWRARLAALRDNMVFNARAEWRECESAPPSSFRGKSWWLWQRLTDQISPTETFLTSIPPMRSTDPTSPRQVDVIHSAERSADSVRHHLYSLGRASLAPHRRLFFASCVLLPFTALLTILPGPNVFLFYNAYRAFCHYRAWESAGYLAASMNPTGNKLEQVKVTFEPDAFLAQVEACAQVVPPESPGAVPQESPEAIAAAAAALSRAAKGNAPIERVDTALFALLAERYDIPSLAATGHRVLREYEKQQAIDKEDEKIAAEIVGDAADASPVKKVP